MQLTVHLTGKNFLSIVVGACVVVLAVIPLKVDATHLLWLRWQISIYVCAAVGVGAIFIQALLQSREDHKRDLREQQSDRRQEGIEAKVSEILVQLKGDHPTPSLIQSVDLKPSPPTQPTTANIDGEVYRLVMSPRGWSWPLVRDLYRIQGRAEEAVIDTDILVEMYLVNRSVDKTRYIRDLRLFAEVAGKRVEFKRQDDLSAPDFNEQRYEYGLRNEQPAEVRPINQLYKHLPLAVAPEQPIEGWVRFMASDINPDKIAQGTITLTVVDSLGNEYSINKVAVEKERQAEVGLRRISR